MPKSGLWIPFVSFCLILYSYIKLNPHPPRLFTTTTTTTTCDIIIHSKNVTQNRVYFGISNLHTHTVIASEQMNNGCKFCLHSFRHLEVPIQRLLKIATSPTVAKFHTRYLHETGRNLRQHSELTTMMVTSYLNYSKCDGKLHKILTVTNQVNYCLFPASFPSTWHYITRLVEIVCDSYIVTGGVPHLN